MTSSPPGTPSSPSSSPMPLTPAPWMEEKTAEESLMPTSSTMMEVMPNTPESSLPSSPNQFVTSTANPSPAKVLEPCPTALTPNSSPGLDMSNIFKFPPPPVPVSSQATEELQRLANDENSKPPVTPVVVVVDSPASDDKLSVPEDSSRSKSPSEMSVCCESESVFGGGLTTAATSSNGESSEGELVFADGTNPRYKTEVCRNFKERSKCVYGDQCQFAHGRRELREVVRNSKYKTKHCQKYWLTGYCAYGPRCNFLHNEVALEDEQFLRRRSRNSTGSSYGAPCGIHGLSSGNSSRAYSETPAAHGGYSRTPPTSSLMTMMPPPPLHHLHAMPQAFLAAAPEVAGWGSGGYKMRAGGPHYHHPTHNRLQHISRGPLPAMRTPPQPMHQDIFSAMGKWTNDYVFPTTTTESIPSEMRV